MESMIVHFKIVSMYVTMFEFALGNENEIKHKISESTDLGSWIGSYKIYGIDKLGGSLNITDLKI